MKCTRCSWEGTTNSRCPICGELVVRWKMRKTFFAVALAVATPYTIGCSSHETFDGAVGILQPTITVNGPVQPAPFKSSGWPVLTGSYGTESPSVSPNECDCAPNFTWVYNGHNWLCKNGTDATLPTKDAFCTMPR